MQVVKSVCTYIKHNTNTGGCNFATACTLKIAVSVAESQQKKSISEQKGINF